MKNLRDFCEKNKLTKKQNFNGLLFSETGTNNPSRIDHSQRKGKESKNSCIGGGDCQEESMRRPNTHRGDPLHAHTSIPTVCFVGEQEFCSLSTPKSLIATNQQFIEITT